MSAPTVGRVSPAQAVAAARAARDTGMAQATAADRDGWDGHVIDQALDAFIATGRRFTANDVRELLPEVRGALIGVRFLNAAKEGRIRRIGYTPSTKQNTHAHPIRVWIRTPAEARLADLDSRAGGPEQLSLPSPEAVAS